MYIFGIDVGGTSIKIGVFLENGTLIEQWEIPTIPQHLMENLGNSILEYLRNKNIIDIT